MNPRLLFLVSVVASVVIYKLTGSRTWSFAVIVACYLPALYEAHAKMTMNRDPRPYLEREGSSGGNR